jgi:hypothetical protein
MALVCLEMEFSSGTSSGTLEMVHLSDPSFTKLLAQGALHGTGISGYGSETSSGT